MDAAPTANTGAAETSRPIRSEKHHKKHRRSHGEKSSSSKESGKRPEANVDLVPPKQAQSDGEAQGQSDVGAPTATVVGDPSSTAQPATSHLSSSSAPLPAAAPADAPAVAPEVAPAVAPGVAPEVAPLLAPAVGPALSSPVGPAVGPTEGATIASAAAPPPDTAPTTVPEGAPTLPAIEQIGIKRPPDANVDSALPKPTQAVAEAHGQSDAGQPTATVTAVTQRVAGPLSMESSRLRGAASATARPPQFSRRISEQAPAFPATEERSPKSVVVPAAVAAAVVLFLTTVVVGSMIWGATVVATSTAPAVSSQSGVSDGSSDGPDISSCPTILNLSSEAAVAATTVGILVGSTVTAGEANLSRWLGVPYAQTTEGERRFAKPEPLNVSDPCAVMEAVEPSPPCAQWGSGAGITGNEDCLRMNIWAPADSAPGEAKRGLVLATAMHWFQRGTNDVPEWEELAARAGVVVMSPNVRLGVLGFLHPLAKGIVRDVAEEDAMAALRWAQDNAAAFGADPSALMLVGNGTGGYLLVQAAGRLNLTVARAVIEGSVYRSAGPANTFKMDPTKDLAAKLGCNVKDSDTWVNCFSDASLEALLSAAKDMELRFTPAWDAYSLSLGFSERKLPIMNDVLTGADVAQARALIEEYVRPKAKANGSASTSDELFAYAVGYLIGSDPIKVREMQQWLKAEDDEAKLRFLALAISGCSARNVALSARRGYHYIVDSGGQPLFEPLLNTADVAQFLSDGRVPTLKNGQAWLPSVNATRLLFANGTEVMDNVTVAAKCQSLTNAPVPGLLLAGTNSQ